MESADPDVFQTPEEFVPIRTKMERASGEWGLDLAFGEEQPMTVSVKAIIPDSPAGVQLFFVEAHFAVTRACCSPQPWRPTCCGKATY